MLELLHGNKRYSSWSMRGYLALTHAGVTFSETPVWLDTPEGDALLASRCPNGTVPALVDDGVTVADSLAIISWLETRYGATFWPTDPDAYAHALNGVMAMHSGYTALREAMVCNLGRRLTNFAVPPAAEADLERIFAWMSHGLATCASRHASPWLCGVYGAADIFYAPVLSRCRTYGVRLPADIDPWARAMEARDDLQAWTRDALAETQRVAASERVCD
ncbi:MAG: glutathione S-transferase N-terminal domain-containing protein [Pseudomonadota bacterium]